MKIKTYGTRGSIPISNKESIIHGGNTTCIRVFDECIPDNMVVIIDAGSGFLPLAKDIIAEGNKTEVLILFTHYHMDHTMGLFLSPITFMKDYNITIVGPLENGKGAIEMMENMMVSPYFPVDIRQVKSHFNYNGINTPNDAVIIINKEGFAIVDVDHYELLLKDNGFAPIGKKMYPLSQCFVIKMARTNHREKTFTFSFKNNITNKKFVFLTDHENCINTPGKLKEHLKDADLAVMDCQYSRNKYDNGFSGYGHSTPDYVVSLAEACNIKKIGLTHHDPDSTDEDINNILSEAKSCVKGNLELFACKDYEEVEVN